MPDAPLVIVNPTAGGGRGARAIGWLRQRLHARPDARLEVTTRAGDAERMAGDAGRDGHDRVVAVGGDGTVQEVVNGLVNGLVNGSQSATLGIVPMGSGNDLARSLGLPGDAGACWTLAIGSQQRTIDLLRADGGGGSRWFSSAGGIGFDAQVARAVAAHQPWQRNRLGYLLTTLSELRRFSNRRVRLTVDGRSEERNVLFVAVANGAYYGGGMRICPDANVDDGLLDLCIVGDLSRLEALRQLPNLYRGTHVGHRAVSMARGRSVEIEGDARTLVHLDGEPFGCLPLRVEVHPDRLSVAARAIRSAR